MYHRLRGKPVAAPSRTGIPPTLINPRHSPSPSSPVSQPFTYATSYSAPARRCRCSAFCPLQHTDTEGVCPRHSREEAKVFSKQTPKLLPCLMTVKPKTILLGVPSPSPCSDYRQPQSSCMNARTRIPVGRTVRCKVNGLRACSVPPAASDITTVKQPRIVRSLRSSVTDRG